MKSIGIEKLLVQRQAHDTIQNLVDFEIFEAEDLSILPPISEMAFIIVEVIPVI